MLRHLRTWHRLATDAVVDDLRAAQREPAR